MLVKNLKIIALTCFALALFSSCSKDEEVFEEQKPQSLISSPLKQTIQQRSYENMAVTMFQNQINWYQNFDPTTCNVNGMLLAFELFDSQGNSLNVVEIFVWDSESGSLETAVNEQIDFYSAEYQQQVTIVFVSGLLIKASENNNSLEIAEVNSFSLFSDYFDNCQSDGVVFQTINDDEAIDWNLFGIPPSTDEVVFPDEPCLSLVFPLEILVATDNANAQPYTVTVNETEFNQYLTGENSNITVIDFVYPVSFVSNDGTTYTANSITEVELLYDQQCN